MKVNLNGDVEGMPKSVSNTEREFEPISLFTNYNLDTSKGYVFLVDLANNLGLKSGRSSLKADSMTSFTSYISKLESDVASGVVAQEDGVDMAKIYESDKFKEDLVFLKDFCTSIENGTAHSKTLKSFCLMWITWRLGVPLNEGLINSMYDLLLPYLGYSAVQDLLVLRK